MVKRNIIAELTNEKLELDKKIDSLDEALKNKEKFGISDNQFELLRRQFNAMDVYSHVLHERIVDLQKEGK